MNVIIFGPPGAGKGTQAQNISNKFNLFQFSTGDLLRNEIQNRTEIGKTVEKVISQGDFVSDVIVNKLLKKIITNSTYRNRIIFDGYPRNIHQAENLEIMLSRDNQSINFIFFLKVAREIIEKRILGRITCVKCNMILNEYLNKKEVENHECGKNYLKKRKDDNLEVLVTRHEEYMKKTNAVLDFYSSRSYFHEIDGNQKKQVITGKIEQFLTV